MQRKKAGPPPPPRAARVVISVPGSQQLRHASPFRHTFTLTYCFQFSAFCWVALAARVCQGWVLGVLARQVPSEGKPTGPLTILCNIRARSVLRPSVQMRQRPGRAEKTPSLFLLGTQVHLRRDKCPPTPKAKSPQTAKGTLGGHPQGTSKLAS